MGFRCVTSFWFYPCITGQAKGNHGFGSPFPYYTPHLVQNFALFRGPNLRWAPSSVPPQFFCLEAS